MVGLSVGALETTLAGYLLILTFSKGLWVLTAFNKPVVLHHICHQFHNARLWIHLRVHLLYVSVTPPLLPVWQVWSRCRCLSLQLPLCLAQLTTVTWIYVNVTCDFMKPTSCSYLWLMNCQVSVSQNMSVYLKLMMMFCNNNNNFLIKKSFEAYWLLSLWFGYWVYLPAVESDTLHLSIFPREGKAQRLDPLSPDLCCYGVLGSLGVGLAVNISGLLYMVCCRCLPLCCFLFLPCLD